MRMYESSHRNLWESMKVITRNYENAWKFSPELVRMYQISHRNLGAFEERVRPTTFGCSIHFFLKFLRSFVCSVVRSVVRSDVGFVVSSDVSISALHLTTFLHFIQEMLLSSCLIHLYNQNHIDIGGGLEDTYFKCENEEKWAAEQEKVVHRRKKQRKSLFVWSGYERRLHVRCFHAQLHFSSALYDHELMGQKSQWLKNLKGILTLLDGILNHLTQLCPFQMDNLFSLCSPTLHILGSLVDPFIACEAILSVPPIRWAGEPDKVNTSLGSVSPSKLM